MDHQSTNPAPNQNSGYDLNTLQDFFDGNEEAVVDILRMMVAEIPVFVEKIEKEAEAAAWQEVYRSAHKFKPVTVNLGVLDMKQIVLQIEERANSETNTEEIPKLISELKEGLFHVKELLQRDFKI